MILEVFKYNQHFVAMMNIINNARLNPPAKGHKHHIIPRCWFKMNNIPVDNSKDNMVLLTYEDHVKVHKLAYHCAKDNIFKSKMAFAYHRLTMGEIVGNGCFAGSNNPMYGKKGELNPNFGIVRSEEYKNNMSRIKKGVKFTDEHKKHLSESHKGKAPKNPGNLKGKHWKLVNGRRAYYG
jgi:hypothetical protein